MCIRVQLGLEWLDDIASWIFGQRKKRIARNWWKRRVWTGWEIKKIIQNHRWSSAQHLYVKSMATFPNLQINLKKKTKTNKQTNWLSDFMETEMVWYKQSATPQIFLFGNWWNLALRRSLKFRFRLWRKIWASVFGLWQYRYPSLPLWPPKPPFQLAYFSQSSRGARNTQLLCDLSSAPFVD